MQIHFSILSIEKPTHLSYVKESGTSIFTRQNSKLLENNMDSIEVIQAAEKKKGIDVVCK